MIQKYFLTFSNVSNSDDKQPSFVHVTQLTKTRFVVSYRLHRFGVTLYHPEIYIVVKECVFRKFEMISVFRPKIPSPGYWRHQWKWCLFQSWESCDCSSQWNDVLSKSGAMMSNKTWPCHKSSPRRELNSWPLVYKTSALTTELRRRCRR